MNPPPATPWAAEIRAAARLRPAPVNALDFHKGLPGSTGAVALGCSDDRIYAVKGIHRGRELCAEQVVARLGLAMGAPMAQVALVYVPQEIIDDNPVEMRYYQEGVSHGSLIIDGCTDRLELEPYPDAHNRKRIAHLAILWGWVIAQDLQVVRLNTAPASIYSVDHGEYFPHGPNWSRGTLEDERLPRAAPHLAVRINCGITDGEIRAACRHLHRVSDSDIAAAVASPPDEWGINLEDRVALAKFLAKRRDDMLASILGDKHGGVNR